jgi:putative transposase
MADERPPHLGRLNRVWVKHPVYFITTCLALRRPLLADKRVADAFSQEWTAADHRHGWQIGRYVIMPDHVHFFAAPAENAKALEVFMARWKEWTAKAVCRALRVPAPLWQHRFFDHVLRSKGSYAEKWEYVRHNPVRAGLVMRPEDWPYAGHIHFDDPL